MHQSITWRGVFFFLFGIFLISSGLEAVSIGASENRCLKALVIIDAGHGGADDGAKMRTAIEKRLTLTTALLTKKHLEALGFRVILTRSRDIFVSLQKRVAIANRAKGAIFVSIHFNSAPNRLAKGIEIFYHESKDVHKANASKKLGHNILQKMIDQTEAHGRGVKKGGFYVIRETTMPSVLVECGFMTNYEERFQLKDRLYLDKIAQGIAQGVNKFLSL